MLNQILMLDGVVQLSKEQQRSNTGGLGGYCPRAFCNDDRDCPGSCRCGTSFSICG